jgi:hypothetical protein
VELKSLHSRILRDELAPHFGRLAFSRRALEYFPVEQVVDDMWLSKLDMSKRTVTVPHVLGIAWYITGKGPRAKSL